MSHRLGNHVLVGTIAMAGALAAVAGGPSPTETDTADRIVIFVLVAGIAALAANAPQRTVSWCALIAGASSASVPFAIAGVIAFAIGRGTPIDSPHRRSIQVSIAAVTLTIAAHSELAVFMGLSALVGLTIGTTLAVAGLVRTPSRARRIITVALVGTVGIGVVGLVAAGYAAIRSLDDLEQAAEDTDTAIVALRAGDVEGARASFLAAREQFSDLRGRFSSPLVALTVPFPVIAQHRRAVIEIASRAASATSTISGALEALDYDALTSEVGRIDPAAVSALVEPLERIEQSLVELGSATVEVRSAWLVSTVDDRLDQLSDDVRRQYDIVVGIREIAQKAPDMLGADRPRNYLVAFTTPSEARGLGGFMGNWALISIDDGRIEMVDFARRDRLEQAAEPGERTLSGPQEWLRRYGQFGFTNGPGGAVGATPWANHTMSPRSESTGIVAAQLFPQSGGTDIDGYFAIDVIAVSRLLQFTGPVATSDGTVLDRENAVKFLLNGQYDDERSERVDLLEEVSRSVIDELLGQRLPSPAKLFDTLGPMVDQGRLVGWAADLTEQAWFRDIGLAGGLPDPEQGDGVTITLNNAVGNKIDFFLRARVDYDVEVDRTTSSARATTLVQLENVAPPTGQPQYVVGNAIGLPSNTNRTYVSIYSVLPIEDVDLDGTSVPFEPGTEGGYFVAALYVETVPGTPRSITVHQAGTVDLSDGYHLVLRSPPTVRPSPVTAQVHIVEGTRQITIATRTIDDGTARVHVEADQP